jgi:hypothetical protein
MQERALHRRLAIHVQDALEMNDALGVADRDRPVGWNQAAEQAVALRKTGNEGDLQRQIGAMEPQAGAFHGGQL